MKRILVGMSGGVDSSLAAALIKESGDTAVGCTLSLSRGMADSDISDAADVCKTLSMEHHIIDLSDDFKKYVIENFISEYLCGRTPNPCVVCNKYIKFGKMIEEADKLGCEMIATGHYARIEKCGERYLLKTASDTQKDQTYMLYTLSQSQLSRSCFPLGSLTKAQVRELAEEKRIATSHKKDSQDICFVEDGDYADFIEKYTGKKSPCGDFCDTDGVVLGRHCGALRYTTGQRKGLGVAVGKPIYVIEKDIALNRVILGDEDKLFHKTVAVTDINYIPFDRLESDMRVYAKLRYRHTPSPAVLHPTENGAVLEFDDPQRAPTAGQSAVFYDGDTVIGGGVICEQIV